MKQIRESLRRLNLPLWAYLAGGAAVVVVVVGAILVIGAVNSARAVGEAYSSVATAAVPAPAEEARVRDESEKVPFRDIEISGTNPFQPKRGGAGEETPPEPEREPTQPSTDDENLPTVPGEEAPEAPPTRPRPPGGGGTPGVPPGGGLRPGTPPGAVPPPGGGGIPPATGSPPGATPSSGSEPTPPKAQSSFWAPFKRPDGKSGGVVRRSSSPSAGSLKLTGTIVGADGRATAVIADGDQRRIVRPGQQVTVDGKTMSVTAVGRTSMTLSGEHGTLTLPLIGGAGQ